MDLSVLLSYWQVDSGKGMLAWVTPGLEDGLCPGPGQRSPEVGQTHSYQKRKGVTQKCHHDSRTGHTVVPRRAS